MSVLSGWFIVLCGIFFNGNFFTVFSLSLGIQIYKKKVGKTLRKAGNY